jgi:aryl-alcohol dehydrogenase-like predicted oxidoreductase
VLSRGLLSGHWGEKGALPQGDIRNFLPRFSGENVARNLELVEALRGVATGKKATVAQVAIAWIHSRGENIVPLVGARRRDRLAEALGALEVELTAEEMAALEEAVPAGAAAGTRYDAHQMGVLYSERGGSAR